MSSASGTSSTSSASGSSATGTTRATSSTCTANATSTFVPLVLLVLLVLLTLLASLVLLVPSSVRVYSFRSDRCHTRNPPLSPPPAFIVNGIANDRLYFLRLVAPSICCFTP